MDQEFPTAAPDMRSLRRKLMWVAMSWTVIIVLAGLWATQYRVQNYRRDVASNGSMRLSSLQDNIENHFRSLAALGQVLARESSFITFLRQDIAPEPRKGDKVDPLRLRQVLTERPDVRKMGEQLQGIVRDFQIRQAYLQNAFATSVADSFYDDLRYSTIGHNFRIRDYFTNAMETGAGFQFVMGRVSHKPGFNFSARIDDGSRALGVLILKTDPASMARLFTDTTGRDLLIVDNNGVVVGGNQNAHLLQQIPNGPSLAGRDKEMEGAYTVIPKPLKWTPISIDVDGRRQTGIAMGRERFLSMSSQLKGYPYTIWVLSPLSAENSIHASMTLATAVLAACGWLVIWAYFRRLERAEAVEQVRRDTLEMTRGLPLTLFRFRVSPEGRGKFAYIGGGVRQLFGVDETGLMEDPTRMWGPGAQAQSRPPTEPTEFAITEGQHKHWISVNSTVATTHSGEQIYDGYWLDVTARRQAELRFEAVFAHASSSFMFFHRREGILRCNPATLSLFGANTFDQLKGLKPWLPPLSLPRQPNGESSQDLAEQLLDSYREGNQPSRFEWQLSRLPGGGHAALLGA